MSMVALEYAYKNEGTSESIDFWDYKIGKKVEKVFDDFHDEFEENLENVEKKVNALSKIIISQSIGEEMSRKRDEVELEIAMEKADLVINDMEETEDIREQIQCVTRLLHQLDTIRKLCMDREKKKLIAFFYSILKMNCDNEIFKKEQLEEFRNIIKKFREEENDAELYNIVSWEKRLRKTGLQTMISWE